MPPNTKAKLLQAAIRVFARKGYKGTTIREINQIAGVANLNAVTYYFNGKEQLYKAVLEFMFEDAAKFIPQKPRHRTEVDPVRQLELFILIYMRILYVIDSELDADLSAIFAKEITHPSPFLDEMVQRYLVPASEDLKAILGEILGPGTTAEVIKDCEASIMGQIYYYQFAWPLIIRCYPDHPAVNTQIEALAARIARFSLGGLEAFQQHPKK